MQIVISGTPCTGKTAVAKQLKKRTNARLISIAALVTKERIPYTHDKKRNTKAVAVRDIKKAIRKQKKAKITIIEGHLAHHLPADYIFILRTDPGELKKRMKKRKWSKEKIKENSDAEIIDAITLEVLEGRGKNVFEIDTTKRTPLQTAKIIQGILDGAIRKETYTVGHIDWTKKYLKELIR